SSAAAAAGTCHAPIFLARSRSPLLFCCSCDQESWNIRCLILISFSHARARTSISLSGDPTMPRLNFGAFLAPHHPVGEHPLLQFRRDLDLVEQLDKLGYDEFWCGEHHSTGWEMIASPEMFLAAAGERTKRIKLATGVVSLPYHHPFNVAQRMVQLDW